MAHNTKKLTSAEFVSRCRKLLPEDYDMSKVVYESLRATKSVIIGCNKHGEFTLSPKRILEGGGCPMCKSGRVFNTISFVEKASKVHGDRYIYDKTEWINNKTPVTITCRIHGDFEQVPNAHSSGYGCRACYTDRQQSGIFLKGQQERISAAKAVHKGAYDYSLFEYKGAHVKTTVVCNSTGTEFSITPDNHINGKRGCPCCRYEKSSKAVMMPVHRVIELVGAKFDNLELIADSYKGYAKPCKFMCKDHGEFTKAPQLLMVTNFGCNSCFEESFKRSGYYNTKYVERYRELFSSEKNNIYVMDFGKSIYKIGIAKNVDARLTDLRRDSGLSVSEVFRVSGTTYLCVYLEMYLHELFEQFNVDIGVDFPGKTELFKLEGIHLDFIKTFSGSALKCRNFNDVKI